MNWKVIDNSGNSSSYNKPDIKLHVEHYIEYIIRKLTKYHSEHNIMDVEKMIKEFLEDKGFRFSIRYEPNSRKYRILTIYYNAYIHIEFYDIVKYLDRNKKLKYILDE